MSTVAESTVTKTKRAVFYDVDGTLLKSNIVIIYLFYALRHARVSSRAREFLKLLSLSPAYKVIDLLNREYFNKIFYKNYKGMNVDRLRQLGQELARDVLIPNMYFEARERIEAAKRQGLVQVFVTGSIDYVIAPFAEHLGIDHIITNKLEIDTLGRATGELIPPILAGLGKWDVMQKFAEEKGIDMQNSYAFADSYADLEMLEAVGFPCVVNPQKKLKTIAASRNWPVLNFE